MLLVLFLGLTHLSAIVRWESLGTKLTYIFIDYMKKDLTYTWTLNLSTC